MALAANVRRVMDNLIRQVTHWRYFGGPHTPAFCLNVIQPSAFAQPLSSHWDIFDDFRILWGVPKTKTQRPTLNTRRFGKTRLLKRTNNLVSCQECGAWHQLKTICSECYKKVRAETLVIKEQMLNYDPHLGEKPDKPIVVVYEGEKEDPDFWNGKRIVERSHKRPEWFPRALKSHWNSNLSSDNESKKIDDH